MTEERTYCVRCEWDSRMWWTYVEAKNKDRAIDKGLEEMDCGVPLSMLNVETRMIED